MTNVYHVRKIKEDLYAIKECHNPEGRHGVLMYLTVGTEKAALIDTGFGVVDTLKDLVSTLTDKPVICLVGHGHPDHAGAAALFNEVFMNEADEELLPVSLSYERRMGDVFGRGGGDEELRAICEKHIVMCDKLSYKPLHDGDRFDLGGKTLQAYAIPGHTRGSIAFLDRDGDYALVSDAFSYRTALVNMPEEKGKGIRDYRDGLSRFLENIKDSTELWWGHGEEPVDHQIPKDMLQACEEVLRGETEQDQASDNHFSRRLAAAGKKMMEHTCGSVMLVYDANRV